jgi:hypothetical protein
MQDCEEFSPGIFGPEDLGIWIVIGMVRNLKSQIPDQMIIITT